MTKKDIEPNDEQLKQIQEYHKNRALYHRKRSHMWLVIMILLVAFMAFVIVMPL